MSTLVIKDIDTSQRELADSLAIALREVVGKGEPSKLEMKLLMILTIPDEMTELVEEAMSRTEIEFTLYPGADPI